MVEPYVMRRAGLDDLGSVLAIIQERADWLHLRGSDQWNHGMVYDQKVAKRVERGFTWLLEDGGDPIATVTIFRRCKSVLWTTDELDVPSLYAWKMATVLDRAGEGLTGLLFRWGQDWAAQHDLTYIRWTVWGASHGLQAHYQRTGAELVRTVEAPTGESAALFQLATERIPEMSQKITTLAEVRRDGAGVLAGST